MRRLEQHSHRKFAKCSTQHTDIKRYDINIITPMLVHEVGLTSINDKAVAVTPITNITITSDMDIAYKTHNSFSTPSLGSVDDELRTTKCVHLHPHSHSHGDL